MTHVLLILYALFCVIDCEKLRADYHDKTLDVEHLMWFIIDGLISAYLCYDIFKNE